MPISDPDTVSGGLGDDAAQFDVGDVWSKIENLPD